MVVDRRAKTGLRDDQGWPRLDDVGTAATLKAGTAPHWRAARAVQQAV